MQSGSGESKKRWKLIRRAFLIFVAVDSVCVALVVLGLILTGFRVGIDVQRLIGKPACMPWMVYVWHKANQVEPEVGFYVVARMPAIGMAVGARPGDRIVKKVAAVPGDKIRIEGTELWINGIHSDRLWLAKSLPGKVVGDFDKNMTLKAGEFFLMGTTKESFDSRYWGPIHREAIIGYAYPVF